MPTLEEVKAQIGVLDAASEILARREVNALPSVLWEDEAVEKVVQGKYGGSQGLLVATNKRLIFVNKALIGTRLRVEDFPYDRITSIQYDTGSFFGDSHWADYDRRAKLTIFASGNRAEIEQIHKKQVQGFGEYVRARTTRPSSRASTVPATPAAAANPVSGEDVISQLERLAALKERGAITDDEFAAEKAKLLSR